MNIEMMMTMAITRSLICLTSDEVDCEMWPVELSTEQVVPMLGLIIMFIIIMMVGGNMMMTLKDEEEE